MTINRVAVIFDDRNRPETTGRYCFQAFQELVSAIHVRPDEAGGLSVSDFDLFVRIDDGIDQPIPPTCRPLVWWAIDTHMDFDRCLAQARSADLTFAAQKPGVEAFLKSGASTAEWLPLACDPSIHRPHKIPKEYDVCFIGNVLPGPRADLLNLLRQHYSNHFIGRAYFDDMARTYSEARVVFNRSIRDDLNMRVFEALACGSLLLTNDLVESGQGELFKDGINVATYRGSEELLDKLRFYLGREDARSRVEQAGLREVVGKHTYQHRMKRILEASTALPLAVSVSYASSSTPADQALPSFDPSYFEFDRPELVALIPTDAQDVVDVGCGAGRLGAALKARQLSRVVGIEKDPRAAAIARSRLDLVLEADAEHLDWPFPPSSFDTVVCGDVLEHLRDPLAFLRRVRTWLRPTGVLVTSLPNVRHHSVIRGLLDGDWTYEPAGLLDHTHLRFFTRRELEKLLYRAGFEVSKLRPVPGPGYAEWEAAGRPGEVGVGRLRIGTLPMAEAEEFYTYQWLAVAHPTPNHDWGLTSIVILAHNQFPCTRQCIDSILLLTDEPFELVLVDNGSTDGTSDYFRALAAGNSRVRIILNEDNLGFPIGSNQGIRASAGRQVLLLNNDTLVTTGWLGRMLQALYSAPMIGMVGPCSNFVSGPQQIPVEYEGDLNGLDGFAWRWGKDHGKTLEEVDKLVGFCLLVRREVIDTIGILDEGFGLGNFEDDDYSKRAQVAGFKLVIARDAFVHHIGGQTFRGMGVDYFGQLLANRWQFNQKWEGPVAAEPRYVPATADRSTTPRILLLAHVGHFRDGMDKSHFYRYEALAERPGVTLFGPGLPGYREGMSVHDAVQVACHGEWPDVIVHGCDPRSSGIPLVTGLAEVPALTAIELLDTWTVERNQLKFIQQNRFSLALIQEAAHHIDFYRSRCPSVEFVWAPNAVNTRLFRDHALQKQYDVILYGKMDPEVYPLSARLARLLITQREFRVLHVSQPGSFPSGQTPTDIVSGEKLSRVINQAWIGIATRSIYNCLLMKYLEIAASATLVAGDMPDTARDVFSSEFIELHLGDSDRDILNKLRTVLRNKPRLQEMISAARQRIVAEFSTNAFADRVLGALTEAVGRRQRSVSEARIPSIPPMQQLSRNRLPDRAGSRFRLMRGVGDGLLLQRGTLLLSGCLIVRDNEGTIRSCLESLLPWVDEMVVVDTGSKDDTPRIAADLGARVFHFPWCDDFSAARNESIRHARGQWVFWMDSDDTINEVNGRGLRALAEGQHGDKLLAFVIQVHCPGSGQDGHQDMTVVDHVKLFRNRPDLRFEGRIHEQILGAVRRAGGEVAWSDLFVVHSGYDHSPEGQKRKKERDLRLLSKELAERPNHPFTLFNLGMTYNDIGRHKEAVSHLEQSIQNSGRGDSHRRKAFALLAASLASLGQVVDALTICEEGLREFPEDLELQFRLGRFLHEIGRFREAITVYQRVLSTRGERYLASVNTGLRGYMTHQNLAAVYSDLGELGLAEIECRAVVAEVPRYRIGWRRLGEILLRQGKVDEASLLADQLARDRGLHGESYLLAGNVAMARGRKDEAKLAWEAGAAEETTDHEALAMLCRLYFETGEDGPAECVIRNLMQRVPNDASMHHNLGSVLLRQGREQEAVNAFRQSLELRPESIATGLCLGYALEGAGDSLGAAEAWKGVLTLVPDHTEAIQALDNLKVKLRH